MDDNKRNLVYFEAPTMRELYSQMDAWQADKRKRLQSVSVHRDGDLFCCIGMTNPSEVVIVDRDDTTQHARVSAGRLLTRA